MRPATLLRVLATMFGTVWLWAAPPDASGQAPARAPGRDLPRLPGAVTDPPRWLTGAPFDVATFFARPPDAENAEPLYLDALFEFGDEMEVCFPPDRRGRADAVKARAARMQPVSDAWSKDPGSVDPRQVDAVVAEYRDGLRKLEEAQRRPRCVFSTGITLDTLLPHAQAARAAARVWLLKAHRDLRRGDVDAAIACHAGVLRLSRDLRPRSVSIGQLVSIALDGVDLNTALPTVLAHPRLTVAHCDRLLGLLKRHEAEAADPFATAVRSEYVMQRATLRVLEQGVRIVAGPDRRPTETTLDRLGKARFVAELVTASRGGTPPDDPKSLEDLAQKLDRAAVDLPKERKAVDAIARTLLAAADGTYPTVVAKIAEIEGAYLNGRGPDSLPYVRLLTPDYRTLALSEARGATYVRGAICLVALRRWQLTRREPPTDLAAVCKAAKLPGVPLDPFSGQPLTLTEGADGPVIYSVGPDGRDDGGLKDAELGRKPEGDLLFPLPRAAAPPRPRR